MISNLHQIQQRHRAFVQAHERMVDAVLREAGETGLSYSRSNPGYTHRTGALGKASKYEVKGGPKAKTLRLLNRKRYAAPIDKGARPHRITARRKPLLRFFWAKQGRWFSGKSVNHPGNRAYRFLWRGHMKAYRHAGLRLKQRMRALAVKW